ncbi:MAG: FeoA domain-containing protein [Promethearchaeia archaeon]
MHKKRKRRRKRNKFRGRKNKFHRKILAHSDLFEDLKRYEEDLLKVVFKLPKKKANISEVVKKITFNREITDIESIIANLLQKNLILRENHSLILTDKGEETAKLILKIHNEIEDYIKDKNINCNAHQMAHILEHKLTEKEIEKMIKASEYTDEGIPMPGFNLPMGTIVDVNLNDTKIWTKLVSIGIFPGQKIHILSRTGHNFVIEIKNSKFAIDLNLAKAILLR